MINVLEDYVWRSIPKQGDFPTNHSLTKKVSFTGAFLPFYGNTVVFDLCDESKMELQKLQDKLYRNAGWMLSQKLDPSTFHMTLHDLVNGPELTEELKAGMAEAEAKGKPLLAQWRKLPPLHMKTTWLFNMVNTSIVLGLVPADAESWHSLDEMYTALESTVHLGHALTPHITMAYFKPGIWSQYDMNYLRQALCPVELEIKLRMEGLHYQVFQDMNHYESK